MKQQFSTMLMGLILKSGGSGILTCIFHRLLLKLRRFLVRFGGDPLIRSLIFDRMMTMNLSHELPRYLAAMPAYGRNLGEVAAAVAEKYPGAGCIDIGANIGDTAVLLRQHTSGPILCIEGDSQYFGLLQQNTAAIRDIICECRFVQTDAHPVLGKLHKSEGTARWVPGKTTSLDAEPLASILERHPGFDTAKLLKTDTDGLDTRIIRSSLGWLARGRSAIFTEFHPTLLKLYDPDALRIFPELHEIGYDQMLVFSNRGSFLFSIRLADASSILEDWYWHFAADGPYDFFDICIFHSSDTDLAEALHRKYLHDAMVRAISSPISPAP